MLVLAPLLSACNDPNQGIDPPRDSLFFPSGLVLDPRTPEGEPAQYLIVTNGNNDLSRNAGTMTVIDLQAFFDRWATDAVGTVSQGNAVAYVNFLGIEGGEGIRAAYPGSTWDRLRQIKAKYDPENLFRLNQNIPPAA